MPMIELHQFRPFWGLPNASPFCMKVETYLRFRGIPYKVGLPSSTASVVVPCAEMCAGLHFIQPSLRKLAVDGGRSAKF